MVRGTSPTTWACRPTSPNGSRRTGAATRRSPPNGPGGPPPGARRARGGAPAAERAARADADRARIEADKARADAEESARGAARALRLADRSKARLARGAEATGLLAATLDVDDSLERLTNLIVPLLADWVVIHFADENGR